MESKIYYYSKKITLKRFGIASLIFIPCSALVVNAISVGPTRKIGLLIIVGIIGILALFFMIISLLILLKKRSKVIEINKAGVSHSENYGSEIDFLSWNEIESITVEQIDNKSTICLQIGNIDTYKSKVTSKEKRAMLESNGIAMLIDDKNLNENLSEILEEINSFYKIYGDSKGNTLNSKKETAKNNSSFKDLTIPILNSEIFVQYKSEVKLKKDVNNPDWVNQNVFFWKFKDSLIKDIESTIAKGSSRKYFVITRDLPRLIQLSRMSSKEQPESDELNGVLFFRSKKTFVELEQLFGTGHLRNINLINKEEHIFSSLENIYAFPHDENISSNQKEIELSVAVKNKSISLFYIKN